MPRARLPKDVEATICAPMPRLFNQAMAAWYFSISERSFEKWWRAGQVPAPLRLGRRLLWDRKILDLWADTVSRIDQPPNDFGD
jgi:hypothetical protein